MSNLACLRTEKTRIQFSMDVHEQISGECLVWNMLENNLALPMVFQNQAEANRFAIKAKALAKAQGFYKCSNGVLVSPELLQYQIMPAIE